MINEKENESRYKESEDSRIKIRSKESEWIGEKK